jgi:hypothetical protein
VNLEGRVLLGRALTVLPLNILANNLAVFSQPGRKLLQLVRRNVQYFTVIGAKNAVKHVVSLLHASIVFGLVV